ncbi:MAG: beta-lactamase family protein [Altererythrobacter sp.]|nr:beta-lactamase family protein [Altererythrobacter sp.]
MAIAAPGVLRANPVADTGLDAFMADQLKTGGVPGCAIGLAVRGRTVFARGYGFANLARRRPVTADSMFHIASVTKTVTATAIMRLAELGRLAIDDAVERHLDFPVRNPAHPDVPITIRHLLMHTSSISDDTYYKVDFRTPGRDSPLALGTLMKTYLVKGGGYYAAVGSYSSLPPGQGWAYSNIGYGLLGLIGSNAAGIDLRRFVDSHIFAPLSVRDTSWTVAGVPRRQAVTPYDMTDAGLVPTLPIGSPDWAGSMLRASIAGFMPYVAASANGGASDRARMLAPTGEAAMLEMAKPTGLPDWFDGQGLGWQAAKLGGVVRPNHWGGDPGVFTAVYLDPTTRSGVAIFTNTTVTDKAKAMVRAVAERVFGMVPGS